VRLAEVDMFGVYVAPIALMMIAVWIVIMMVRIAAGRFGLLRFVWHPALFTFAVYVVFLSSWILILARRSP
jgi:hypothetical protein